MTNSQLVTIFKNTFTAVSPSSGKIITGRRPDVSLLSVNTPTGWPLVCVTPFREAKNYKTGVMTRQCVLFFITQDSTENTEAERDALVNSMEALADAYELKLIELLGSSGQIQGDILRTPERQTFPGYCSGYSISFSIVSKIDVC